MPSIDLGNVMGPQGPQGSIWYQGTAITGTSSTATVFAESGIEEARVYDKYFNTGTNDIYTCVTSGNAETAEWVWIGNIRGGTGPIGPVGPTGSVDMDTPITFTEAETMANIESGESVATIFGKIKKIAGNLLEGAASTLLGKKLTASKVLVSDASGNVGASTITSTELGYLDGVMKNIQEQFNEQNVNIEELNGKITTRSVLVAINGTTDETGGIIVNVNTDFTNKFVISNISDTSITPYKITIINHSSDFIYFRFRKYSDNSAVTNTAVDTTVLVVGMN